MGIKYETANHSIVESYRSIRTTIMVNKDIKTILITSSEKGEGKTTTVTNLAKCFSDLESKKVLLIDCDLRRPSVHRRLGADNTIGLMEVLKKNSSLEDCLTYHNGLHILTAGKKTQNPAEILESESMRQFIKSMRNNYDYIFIDSPPISRVNDACIISKYIDGTIIVSASNEIDRNLAKTIKQRLNKVNANIIGIILNKFKDIDDIAYEYYGYYEEPKKGFMSKFKFNKKRS